MLFKSGVVVTCTLEIKLGLALTDINIDFQINFEKSIETRK